MNFFLFESDQNVIALNLDRVTNVVFEESEIQAYVGKSFFLIPPARRKEFLQAIGCYFAFEDMKSAPTASAPTTPEKRP